MECVPQCAVCNGLCHAPASASSSAPAKNRRPIGTKKGGYILLVCLHFTTPEEQLLFRSVYGVRSKRRYWCDDCEDWKTGHKVVAETTEPGVMF